MFTTANPVTQNGLPGALMQVRKTGGVSTLAVIDGIKSVIPEIAKDLPLGVTLKTIFDRSILLALYVFGQTLNTVAVARRLLPAILAARRLRAAEHHIAQRGRAAAS
jgi:hypothetical protein